MPLTKSQTTLSATEASYLINSYWIEKLEGIEELQLPKDHSKSLTKGSKNNTIYFQIDKSLLQNIITHFSESKPGPSLILLAALKVLLYRYSNQIDFCIGTTFRETVPKIPIKNGVKNFYLDFLPIGTKIDDTLNFGDFVKKLGDDLMEANSNNQIFVDQLISILGKKNKKELRLLFPVIFDYQKNADLVGLNRSSKIALENFNSTLLFGFVENDEKIEGSITYDKEFFSYETVNRMASHYATLLETIHSHPSLNLGLLNIVPTKEKTLLLETLNATEVEYPHEKTIVDMFEEQVNRNPDAIALEFDGNLLTYSQLDSKSNQLAHYLKKIGIKSETPVPICLDRSLEMIIAIIGIIKAGGAYVPIDPFFPADRIDYMIEDTGANIVICSTETSNNFGEKINRLIFDKDLEVISEMPSEKVSPSPLPDNLVYIIYTSGSTGKPKGAIVEHRNLVNFVNSLSKIVEYDSSSIQLSVTTYIFDAFCLELFVPLAVGAKVILVSKEVSMDGFKLAKALAKHKPSHMQATASGWQLLLNAGWNNPEGIIMTTGGEAIGEETKNLLAQTGKLWNLYGPTETTITSAFKKLEVHEKVTIGKPIDNTKIYILSPGGSLNPLGIPGELCISGKGVGRGYLNRPELTAEKFVPDHFSDDKDAVMYHTGDLARWLPDGNLEFLGRLDDQVKIRGYRIELGEIESNLQLHPSIKQAVVLAKENNQGDKRLVGYVVCNGSFDSEAVISFLRIKLPDYMIPSHWKELENLPLAFSGKVDRKALSEMEIQHIPIENYEAPKTEFQNQLAAIWQKTLGLKKVGIQDDFFVLGGHSLLAMKVIATIRSEMGIELSIRDMFNFPTIQQLAEILESNGSIESDLIPHAHLKRPEIIPLSYNQQSLWFIHQLSGSTQYHIPLIFRINGNIVISSLEDAFKIILNRHEALHTVIREKDGIDCQILLRSDLWKLGRKVLADPKLLKNEISKLIKIPYDLTKDYMLRACIITLAPDDHCLILTMHHIASDGWSSNILRNELWESYHSLVKGIQVSLPPLPIQYIDYALWQRNFLKSDAAKTKIDYWKAKLKNVSPLQLPTDFGRPPIQSNHGNSYHFSIDNSTVSQLRKLGHSQQTTLFMTLLAAFKTLLYRHSGQEDICVGTPVAGRENTETEGLLGHFVNTLAIRSSLKGSMSFTELLKEIRVTTLDAFEFQQIPFEIVVESLGQERDLSRNPVFQVLFVLQNIPKNEVQLEDALVSEETYEHFTSKFDLTFELIEVESGIEGIAEYNTDLFRPETIERFVSHYTLLLKSILKNPSLKLDFLNIIPTKEKTYLLETLNATVAEYPHDKTIVDLFEEQVNKAPEAIALIFEEKKLSYKELNEWSNRFAHYLIGKYKIQPDDLVGIELERSEWMVVVILGIIKSGGAYVPIDPEYPEQRKEFIREDAKLKIVINQVELEVFRKAIKEGNFPNTNPITQISPENLMYVIYTSGSTGIPKGCMLEHRSLVNRLAWMQKSYALTEEDCILQKTAFTFDVSVWELIWWSLQGACVSMLEPGGEKQPEKIVSTIEASLVTVVHFVPSMLGVFLDYLSSSVESILKLSSLKQVYTSGEALQVEQVKRFKELFPAVSLMNLYGPTEASIDVSYYTCEKEEELSIPIGKPIDNTVLYVLNSSHHLVPYGIVGEICIGGIGLARGYLNREELTREKFIENPYRPKERIYRTGDLGRWREDGNLEYLGRMDDQVKLRGYRIELSEIESVLLLHPSMKQAVVMVKEYGLGDKRLVGYIVCDGTFDKKSINEFLRSKLPEYMIPALWIALERLPLTSSGKIDRKALPDVSNQDMVTAGNTEPKSDLEKQLAALWKKILALDRVGIHDDFFALGGHSLLAVKVMSALEKEMGSKLAINLIFKYPNISELANAIENINQNQVGLNSLLDVKTSGRKPPLYMVHGGESSASIYYNLAKYIDNDQPIFGFQPKGLDGIEAPDKSLEEMAAYYISLMVEKNPDGPYNLSGYCFGGIVAYEMAKQLQSMGKKVNKLILFDTVASDYRERHSQFEKIKLRLNIILAQVNFLLNEPEGYLRNRKRYLKRKMDLIFSIMKMKPNPQFVNTSTNILNKVSKNNTYLLNKYKLVPYHGALHLFRAKTRETHIEEPKFYGWNSFVEKVNVINIGGHHFNILTKPEILKEIAEKIQIVLDEKNQ